VTFIRAIDVALDPVATLETLVAMGIDTVLTSGAQPSAIAGSKLIKEFVERAGNKISVMAGAGVTAENVAQLVAETGVKWVHGSCRSVIDGPMNHRAAGIYMGAPPCSHEAKTAAASSGKRKREDRHPLDPESARKVPFDGEYMFKTADHALIAKIVANANSTRKS